MNRSSSHARAVALMLLVTLMWSIAGVVTKRLDSAASFEVTFWRSSFLVVALVSILSWMRGPKLLMRQLLSGGWPLVISSLAWCGMFTAFMVAMTLTSVANVLITMALGPLFTALLAHFALGHRLKPRTWLAIVVAGIGIAWMVGDNLGDGGDRRWLGMAVALIVPVSAAINWTLLQRMSQRARLDEGADVDDLMPALVWGAALSALITFPLSMPWAATPHDLAWLAILGLVQLAIPCLLAVKLTGVLSAPEMSLLALTEVVFGVALAWIGTSESPSLAVVGGGCLVIGALAVNEWLTMREGRRVALAP